ncbi:MAG: pectin acetylesterase-family hydrolase, partial [Nannocystaceae bacterium]
GCDAESPPKSTAVDDPPTQDGDSDTDADADTDSDTDSDTDGYETPDPIVPPSYGEWHRIDIPGAVCSNGSQYPIFVNFSETSDNVVVMFEPGGACWDYEGCSGKTALGAANPNGVPDNHMVQNSYLSPLIRRDMSLEDNPMQDWNFVFMPYCTGDVHTGNNVVTYTDPNGSEPDIVFHHNGHENVDRAAAFLNVQFPTIPRLMVTGCSAGGAGAIINYHFLRERLNADRGYLLNDSGPIFPSDGWSQPLHSKIRSSWDVDPILDLLPGDLGADVMENFGALNGLLADLYPEDRLSTTFFQRDYNYSRYSYENFYDNNSKEEVLSYWKDDTDLMTADYDSYDNLAYYLPYWRELNTSHCVSIVAYVGTEIEEQDMDLRNFVGELLDDDAPLNSYRESVQANEDN